MSLLLDSHVALWWLIDDDALGTECRREIVEADRVLVSVVTPWELGIKRALGKLTMPDGIVDELTETGIELLPIQPAHAELAPALPLHHRDPFDRMLVAQARLEALRLVTADRRISPYDVATVDPRR